MNPGRHRKWGVIIVGALVSSAPLNAQAVLYEHPAAKDVVPHSEATASGLEVDLYFPPSRDDAEVSPAVVFVLAYPDGTRPGPLRDLEPYPSWARLVAAEGFVGVLYETHAPVADLSSLMSFLRTNATRLRIDPERVALWSASGNTALALKYARMPGAVQPAALIAYYGVMPTPDDYQGLAFDSISERFGLVIPDHEPSEAYSAELSLFIVRAGLDTWSEILNSIDHFVEYALDKGLALTLRSYPSGHHGFDFQDNVPETRLVIRETIDFLRNRLRE